MKLSALMTLLSTAIGSAGAAPAPACALTLPPLAGASANGVAEVPGRAPGVLLVDSDNDLGGWLFFGHDHDDDDDDDDDCDDDDDDEHECGGKGGGNAAPAGSVAPPKNGLFGGGKPPVVKTN